MQIQELGLVTERVIQFSKFLFNMGSKRRPVTHAKLSPGQSGNCMPPHQRFPLQKHHDNLDLISLIRDTTHNAELLHSKEPITQFGRIAFKLTWFVSFHFGPSNSSWTHGWLLGFMGNALSFMGNALG